MVGRRSVEHTALGGSKSFKPPALPVVTHFIDFFSLKQVAGLAVFLSSALT
jgi:hypothetical protein